MKISELVKQTQVSKETIHYYIREGLLPRPRKLGKNVADYNESYVERIRIIKEFQDHCFLPLSVIKKILKYEKGSPEREWYLQLHTDYFRPVDKLLPTEIAGEQDFRKATGLGRRWLAKMEEWRIITPQIRNDQKIYSQDDLTLGKVVVDMDRIGLGPKDGFDPEALKFYSDLFRDIVVMSHRYYRQAGSGQLSASEYAMRSVQAREIMSVFFYHLYRKLSREEHEKMPFLPVNGKTEGSVQAKISFSSR
ncbi:MAG: MerR family transcriptional regulator [Desulfomonile tiedjei]|nr:MerR family transcriptional regulator [Desulfomonile tiedjei]